MAFSKREDVKSNDEKGQKCTSNVIEEEANLMEETSRSDDRERERD